MADTLDIRDLTQPQERGLNIAAALARRQFEYARQIAAEAERPGHTPDSALVGAIALAIATNYATIASSGG